VDDDEVAFIACNAWTTTMRIKWPLPLPIILVSFTRLPSCPCWPKMALPWLVLVSCSMRQDQNVNGLFRATHCLPVKFGTRSASVGSPPPMPSSNSQRVKMVIKEAAWWSRRLVPPRHQQDSHWSTIPEARDLVFRGTRLTLPVVIYLPSWNDKTRSSPEPTTKTNQEANWNERRSRHDIHAGSCNKIETTAVHFASILHMITYLSIYYDNNHTITKRTSMICLPNSVLPIY